MAQFSGIDRTGLKEDLRLHVVADYMSKICGDLVQVLMGEGQRKAEAPAFSDDARKRFRRH